MKDKKRWEFISSKGAKTARENGRLEYWNN